MDTLDLTQGSEEWLQARAGSLGASCVHEALARTKSGWGATRANLMARLVAERLTGRPSDTYTNAAMQHGTTTEPEARAAYEFRTDVDVAQVGLIKHPSIAWSHASPDGLVGDVGLLEIKCPSTATHIDTLLGQKVPEKYRTQMLWQLACTGRSWCDFVSYDNRMPESMRMFVARVHRDDEAIAELENNVREFLVELEDKLAQLQAAYGVKEAA